MGEWMYSSAILNFGAIWRRVVSFTSLALYLRGNSPDTHCVGGWVGPRTSLEVMEKRKTLAPAENQTLAVHPIARRYTD
jgi:hypothetical protein